MRSNSLTLFLLLSVVGLLCLMPVWYFFLAPWLAEPVFFLAGKLVSDTFHWVVTYRLTDTQATLLTSLQFIAAPGQGRSAARCRHRAALLGARGRGPAHGRGLPRGVAR